jgi:prepilin-type N-terminal cleavage/methylation domain-containing protein
MNRKAFTLIELMVTISIIAILTTIAIPIFDRMILKARSDEAKTVIESIVFAQERYKQETGAYYPPNREELNEENIVEALKINLSQSNNFIYSITTSTTTGTEYDNLGNEDGNFTVRATLRKASWDVCGTNSSSTTVCKENGTINEEGWVEQYYSTASSPNRFLLLRYPARLKGNINVDSSTVAVTDFMEGGISYARLHEK